MNNDAIFRRVMRFYFHVIIFRPFFFLFPCVFASFLDLSRFYFYVIFTHDSFLFIYFLLNPGYFFTLRVIFTRLLPGLFCFVLFHVSFFRNEFIVTCGFVFVLYVFVRFHTT